MRRLARWSVIRWLAWDTFRQARSSRVFWLMMGISALCICLCLSLRIDAVGALRLPGEIELYGGDQQPLIGPNPKPGHLNLAFGGIELPLFRDVEDEVHFLQVLLARWILGVLGTFLLVVGTAGFLPEFLQPDAVSVLLSKPVSRPFLFLGKVGRSSQLRHRPNRSIHPRDLVGTRLPDGGLGPGIPPGHTATRFSSSSWFIPWRSCWRSAPGTQYRVRWDRSFSGSYAS